MATSSERDLEGRKLLLVEDCEADRVLFKQCVRARFQVDDARSVDEACRVLSSVEYDAVLLDMNLSGNDGVGLLRWSREHRLSPKPIVVVWSSSAEPQDVNAAFAAGANLYFQKPQSLAGVQRFADFFEHMLSLPVELESGA